MEDNLPDGAWLRIKHNDSCFESKIFIGNLLDFGDGIVITSDSREKAIFDNKADISLVSVSEQCAEIEDVRANKKIDINLGEVTALHFSNYGIVQIELIGVRIGADSTSFDNWIKLGRQ